MVSYIADEALRGNLPFPRCVMTLLSPVGEHVVLTLY